MSAKAAAPQSPGGVGAAIEGRATVIDGDTIEIHGARIRLHGIDAFESRQMCANPTGGLYRCGREAAFALDALLAARTISCVETDRDRWGRIVAICMSDDHTDIGKFMVRAGWALAYRKYSSLYVAEELAARAENKGAWAGSFQPPDEWRKASRKQAGA